MTHHLWGPPPDTTEVYLSARFEDDWLRRYFADVRQVGELNHPLSVGTFHHAPIFLCRKPYQPLSLVWSDFKRFHH